MKNNVFLLLLLCLTHVAWTQKNIAPTDAFTISGKVAQPKTVSLADLQTYPAVKIKNVVVTNHLGEKKGKARAMKGVLLKTILEGVEFQSESPKVLSEFYLTFVASDGYKVVFSWNEIFNTETGNHLYVVVEKEGKGLSEMDGRMLLLCSTDFKTGRRYLKGLSNIIVNRVD